MKIVLRILFLVALFVVYAAFSFDEESEAQMIRESDDREWRPFVR